LRDMVLLEVIMKKKITIFAILIASIFIGVPADGFGSTTAKTNSVMSGDPSPQISVRIGQPRRRRGGYYRDRRWNHGRYRRSMVGYRRYRMVPRYYWDDGRRHVRYVRVYY
jgi:hypothetical protein